MGGAASDGAARRRRRGGKCRGTGRRRGTVDEAGVDGVDAGATFERIKTLGGDDSSLRASTAGSPLAAARQLQGLGKKNE